MVVNNPDAAIQGLSSAGFVALGRKDLPHYPFSLPFDWAANPFSDRNWMFQLHGWRMLDAFFNRMAPDDVAFIGEVMSDWWRFYQADPDATPWYWYDMSTGLRASKIAYLVHWCEENGEVVPLAPGVLQCLVTEHVSHLTNPEELNHGNHGLSQLQGLMGLLDALAKTGRTLPNQSAATEFAVSNMRSILLSQLGEQGVHTEDAPDYHFFALSKIRQILDSPWWQRDDMADINALFDRAEVAKEWLVTPSMHCPPVGDSAEAAKLKRYSRLGEWPHQVQGESMAAWLDGYGVVRSLPEVALADSHYLFFQGSFHSSGHKHADCLSFVWQEGNRYRLWDSGKYGYQKDDMRAYFQSTRAHNTLEIDGKDFSRSKADGYGSAIQEVVACAGGWLLSGKVFHKRLQVTHQRILFYRPGIGVDVLDKVVNHTEAMRRYQLWWHLGEETEVAVSGQSAKVLFQGEPDLVFATASSVDCSPELSVFRGEEKPRLLGWISREYLKFEPSTCMSVSWESREPEQFFATCWRLASCPDVPPAFEVSPAGVKADDPELSAKLTALLGI